METGDNLSIRVASFSCYLDTAKDNLTQRISAKEAPLLLTSENAINTTKSPFDTTNFVFKVPGGPIQDPTSAFSFPCERIAKDHNSEISVFSADKYFNMKLQNQNQKPPNLPNPALTTTTTRTQSLCSEASSLNSQTALLPGSGLQIKQRKALGRRIFTGFGCQTPCFNRKAVNVDEIIAPVSRAGSQRINHLALGTVVSNSGTEGSTIKELNVIHRFGKPGNAFEEPRGSIEVFGSTTIPKGDQVAKNMERKLSILTWDAIPKGQTLPTSTVGSSTILDDMASDASSDLFEIEHISGSLHPLSRAEAEAEATDDRSSCMSPQSQYAPSEASIHWSVVTASCVADNCSVLSEYNDEMSASVAGDVIARSSKTRVRAAKEEQKSPRIGILGCNSHKAVDVAENVAFGKSQGNRGRVQDIGTPELPRALW